MEVQRCDGCGKEFREFNRLDHLYKKKNPQHLMPFDKPFDHVADYCHDCMMALYEWRDKRREQFGFVKLPEPL